jgi:hypothetical protein
MRLSPHRSNGSTPCPRLENTLIGLVPGDLLRSGLIVSSYDAESVSTQIMANPTHLLPLSQNNTGAQKVGPWDEDN